MTYDKSREELYTDKAYDNIVNRDNFIDHDWIEQVCLVLPRVI